MVFLSVAIICYYILASESRLQTLYLIRVYDQGTNESHRTVNGLTMSFTEESAIIFRVDRSAVYFN